MEQSAGAERTHLSIPDAAKRVGLSIGVIKRWLQTGLLKRYKPVAGRTLVSIRELDDLIARSANTTQKTGEV